MSGDLFPYASRRMPGGQFRSGYAIACAACPDEKFWVSEQGPQPLVKNHFERAGWFVAATGRHRCKSCAAIEQTRARDERRARQEKAMTKQDAPTPDASAKLAELYVALGEHYDAQAKTYRAGYSDAKLAQIIGVSESLVAKRREADFGPLPPADTFLPSLAAAIDNEIAALAREKAALKRLGEQAFACASGLSALMDNCALMESRLGAIRHRIVERMK